MTSSEGMPMQDGVVNYKALCYYTNYPSAFTPTVPASVGLMI